MSTLLKQIETLLNSTIIDMGYEFVGVELLRGGKHSTLRVYIDSDQGVNVDDCGKVSHQVSAILDVEDPIHTQYTLEVSSPGIERPLFKLQDYQRFLGYQVTLRFKHLVEGKRKLCGEISKVSEQYNQIELLTNIQTYNIDIVNIDKANLVANF